MNVARTVINRVGSLQIGPLLPTLGSADKHEGGARVYLRSSDLAIDAGGIAALERRVEDEEVELPPDYIFEPDLGDLARQLFPELVVSQIYRSLLESSASWAITYLATQTSGPPRWRSPGWMGQTGKIRAS